MGKKNLSTRGKPKKAKGSGAAEEGAVGEGEEGLGQAPDREFQGWGPHPTPQGHQRAPLPPSGGPDSARWDNNGPRASPSCTGWDPANCRCARPCVHISKTPLLVWGTVDWPTALEG